MGGVSMVLARKIAAAALFIVSLFIITACSESEVIDISDTVVIEGNDGDTPVHFNVSLSFPVITTVTVDWHTEDGTAMQPSDYTAAKGQLQFSPGERSAIITVQAHGDNEVEDNETFYVVLSNPVGALLGRERATATLLNDDDAPPAIIPVINVSPIQIEEGDSGTKTATFEVNLSEATTQVVSVRYTITDGSASISDNDYQAASPGQLQFAAGETSKNISVTINGDEKVEADETFVLNLSDPQNATLGSNAVTATILNDDRAPVVPDISIADLEFNEGDNDHTVQFVVTLSEVTTNIVKVDYKTSEDTAEEGSDYDTASGTLLFPAGTTQQNIDITIKGDTTQEDDETFYVILTNPDNATLGSAHTAAGRILNDDIAAPPPSVSSVTVTPSRLSAGGEATVSWQSNNQHHYFFYLYDKDANLAIDTADFLAADCAAAGSNGSDGCLGQENPSSDQSDTWRLPSVGLPAGNYTIKVAVWNEEGQTAASFSAPFEVTVVSGELNDTGITFGGNYPWGNNSDCSGETIAQQDCSHGRDVTHNDDSDGHAGFSYTKLDADGSELPASASSWSCVRDNVTGLIWEVKQGGNGIKGDEGLHDADDRFNWYNTDPASNGGSDGSIGDAADSCFGYTAGVESTYCNTQAYTARVNAAALCGASDWRMPDITELDSIINFDRENPAIDTDYFPGTEHRYEYWSGTPGYSGHAWIVHFKYGDSVGVSYQYNSAAVRLVRDGE